MHTTRILTSTAFALVAVSAPAANAQDDGAAMAGDIPAEYATLPSEYVAPAETMGEDGVETITRTRWVERRAEGESGSHHNHMMGHGQSYQTYGTYPAAYSYPVRFDRESWLAECHARTRDLDDNDGRKGGIIGALLGAIGGGVIGNRAWDSERLLGTVVGAGVGGLAGYALGSAIGDDDDDDYRYRYDCEAALDRYMRGASYPVPHVAARAIPAYHYGYMPGPAYGYASMYAAECGCSQPMTMIEVREEIPQRVVVREKVREEWVDEPEAIRVRVIEEEVVEVPDAPSGKIHPIKSSNKMIKGS